jgi:hypothetical protein
VEQLDPSQTKEETIDSSHASAVGATATSESSVPTDQKKKQQYAYGLLKISSLKEGAM